MIDKFREGRAALVTSFSCFKFMALYSMIQFTTICFLYSFGSSLADYQFLYIDLFMILPLAILMERFDPADKICKKRPMVKLISYKVLSSILGQILLQAMFQVGVYLLTIKSDWYVPTEVDPEELVFDTAENTSLFLFSCFVYVTIGFVYCAGRPYRQPVHTNSKLMF